jgi:hypothetical protein
MSDFKHGWEKEAVEVSWDEYDKYMLQTRQWLTAEEQYAIEQALDAFDSDLDYCYDVGIG